MGYPHIRGTVVAAEWQPSFIHLWLGIGCPDFLRPVRDPAAVALLCSEIYIQQISEYGGTKNV